MLAGSKNLYSVGELFRVEVFRVNRPDGDSYLKMKNDALWRRVSRAEAETFIRTTFKKQ
jgi:hypothetical protein